MENFILARARKAKKISAKAGSGFSLENTAGIAFVVILIIIAYLVLQGGGPAGSSAPTTVVSKITSTEEAGETISDLSSSAAGLGSILASIDNSIG